MITITGDTENLKIDANAGYVFSLACKKKSQGGNR